MKRATITISDDLDQALAEYGRDQDLPDDVDALVEAALRSLLADHGYLAPIRSFLITPIEHDVEDVDRSNEFPYRPFNITPLHREDGPTDISENHDRYFADGETSGSR
ncbi:MAG: hypothetical protein M3Q10_00370 [Chloroflexota bacterium]|nr:hypothetical protein [Chloroflexota bacterium]